MYVESCHLSRYARVGQHTPNNKPAGMLDTAVDDGTTECRPVRHVLCFFMCYDVRPQMARFMWLLTLLVLSIGFVFAARGCARAFGFGHQFGVVVHLAPLMMLAFAHVVFLGLKFEDSSARDPDHNIDPVMVRIMAATLIVVVALFLAMTVTMERWWSDPISEERYVYGPKPEHASPSSKPDSGGGGIPNPFKSPSRTPSHTPTASPDPAIREREYQRLSDRRSVVGALYMSSVLSGIGAVLMHYHLRMLPVAYQ